MTLDQVMLTNMQAQFPELPASLDPAEIRRWVQWMSKPTSHDKWSRYSKCDATLALAQVVIILRQSHEIPAKIEQSMMRCGTHQYQKFSRFFREWIDGIVV